MAAAMPREPHTTVRSSKSRAEYHPASRPISKAVAHAEACAARIRVAMEQVSTASVSGHTEEVLLRGEAAAPGV